MKMKMTPYEQMMEKLEDILCELEYIRDCLYQGSTWLSPERENSQHGWLEQQKDAE